MRTFKDALSRAKDAFQASLGMRFRDAMSRARSAYKVGLGIFFKEVLGIPNVVRGEVFLEMRDAATGALLHEEHRSNLIMLDAGILVAMLLRDPSSRPLGVNMLAVGTGAMGPILSPNAPDNRQRKLNAEIARKTFSSTTFRDSLGNAVSYPTNVTDFVCSFGEAEAVGPLNEMGLVATLSANASTLSPNPDTYPSRDTTRNLTEFDIFLNVLNFAVISKPSTAVLSITWRITT